ncbi:MAG: SsrA-binding protein [Candidatus Anoxychlamydiales bacterium]|nr:SsrA-binding protein [Candidatus Anoxychlamydiales bacterium]NGX35558.1 SsrA-binding protein [Candidatus Anoxychlamydiales bacterium]
MKALVSNKKAYHDYEILDTFEAGMALLGSEIKSLRNHGGSLQDAYVDVKDNELWLMNSTIAPYKFAAGYTHKDRRKRKLLMHRREILKLKKQIAEKGVALIALSIYLKKGRAKIKIAIAKGKKAYDKRAKLKEKAQKKEIQKAIKY